jgi:uncharacterized protein
MSVALPERVDASRMVQARRTFEGKLPIASFQRLRSSLAAVESGAKVEGDAQYDLEFGRDELGVAYLAVRVDADLPLTCQRTLELYRQPVHVDQRLGLIGEESEEAALPPGYEPLLIPDGMVDPAAVIEDELILALPVVPLKPGAPLEWHDAGEDEAGEPNPFAALAGLKKKKRS